MNLPLYSLLFFSFSFLQSGEKLLVPNYGSIQQGTQERSDTIHSLQDMTDRAHKAALEEYKQEAKNLHHQLDRQNERWYFCCICCCCLEFPSVENLCDKIFGDTKE